MNDTRINSIRELYQRLLEAAKETARRNQERLDNLRRQYDLPDEVTSDLDLDENAAFDG